MGDLQIIEFTDRLWRADREDPTISFAGAPYKFFALRWQDTASYKNRETDVEYAWLPREPLRLIDMTDVDGYNRLFQAPNNIQALHTAFPKRNGRIARYSDAKTTNADYRVIRRICEEYGDSVDGYILRGNSELIKFHDEIALCGNALNKLQYDGQYRYGEKLNVRQGTINLDILKKLAAEASEIPKTATAPAIPVVPNIPIHASKKISFNNMPTPPPLKRQKINHLRTSKRKQARRLSRRYRSRRRL